MTRITQLRKTIDNALIAKKSLIPKATYNRMYQKLSEQFDNKQALESLAKTLEKYSFDNNNFNQLRNRLSNLKKNGDIDAKTNLKQSKPYLQKILDEYSRSTLTNMDDYQYSHFKKNEAYNDIHYRTKPTISQATRFRNIAFDYLFSNPEFSHTTSTNPRLNIINYAYQKIKDSIKQLGAVKVGFSFNLIFRKPHDAGDVEDINNMESMYFIVPITLNSRIILTNSAIAEELKNVLTEVMFRIESYEGQGSGHGFTYVQNMNVSVIKYKPLKGGSYLELDAYLNNKKCLINIKNDDDKCLMYCVLLHINLNTITKNRDRVSQLNPFLTSFDWNAIKFPANLNQIEKVENLVQHKINVFGYDDKHVFPLRISKWKKEDDIKVSHSLIQQEKTDDTKVINLLLVSRRENGREIQHYVYIKNIDKLVAPNQRDENGKHVEKMQYPCLNCLHRFSTKDRLKIHREGGCDLNEPTKTNLPKQVLNEDGELVNPVIKFKNHTRKYKAPVVIYADFETLVQPLVNIDHNPLISSTTRINTQTPCGFAFNIVSDYPELDLGLKLFRGENAVDEFLKQLLQCGDKIKQVLKTEQPMIITPAQEKEFQKATICSICESPLTKEDRVRDHDHITGLYRGCAHNKCNINFNHKNFKIPVYFHNLKGFDGHLIIQGLKKMNFSKIDIIAQNFEKYMTFSFGDFRFLDSFAFLTSGLATLTENLLTDGKKAFPQILKDKTLTDEQQDLILKKGVYPYEHMKTSAQFEETQLPPIEDFYSSLGESEISDVEYSHAQNVWNKFNIKTMGEYHDLYLKTDVLLLSDVFENFRNVAMTHYEIDPANGYFTLPNFAWDAMLKMTKIELEQLTDVDKYIFCEKGLRGGTSMISHRYAKANNKYMAEHNPDEISSYIMYLDANNLYGHSMSQKLPTGNFQWIDNATDEWIRSVETNDDTGYFVECDLHYPIELHDMHNNYPLAVEQRGILKSELSPYQQDQLLTHNEGHSETSKKLIPNFYDKIKYVCHIRNLQYYISKGLVITKIHRVMSFDQSEWLKMYIDFNTIQRSKAKNDFEKDFFKLMNNAVFGKTMENMRARVKIELHTDAKEVLYQVAKPQFMSQKIYSESLIAIKQVPKKVELCKPIYVGLAVLDLSKLHMYDFHYEYIVPKYGEKATLLFTDTDSLCYHIKTEDMYKDMREDKHLFDQSGYSGDGFRSVENSNKKIIGKFKDETDGVPIVEFCGLRSKMYSILLETGKEKKTGKGIKKSALKKKVSHADYKRCLFGSKKDQRQLVSFNNMRSVNHEIFSYNFTKLGLSCSNDKQYLLEDGITSLSYGHYRIPEN